MHDVFIMSLLPPLVHYGMYIKGEQYSLLCPLIEALKGEIHLGAMVIVERQLSKYFLFCISILFLISTVMLQYVDKYTGEDKLINNIRNE